MYDKEMKGTDYGGDVLRMFEEKAKSANANENEDENEDGEWRTGASV